MLIKTVVASPRPSGDILSELGRTPLEVHLVKARGLRDLTPHHNHSELHLFPLSRHPFLWFRHRNQHLVQHLLQWNNQQHPRRSAERCLDCPLIRHGWCLLPDGMSGGGRSVHCVCSQFLTLSFMVVVCLMCGRRARTAYNLAIA